MVLQAEAVVVHQIEVLIKGAAVIHAHCVGYLAEVGHDGGHAVGLRHESRVLHRGVQLLRRIRHVCGLLRLLVLDVSVDGRTVHVLHRAKALGALLFGIFILGILYTFLPRILDDVRGIRSSQLMR